MSFTAAQLSLLDAGLGERHREIFLCIADELALCDGLPSRYLSHTGEYQAPHVDGEALRRSIRTHLQEIRQIEAARLRIKSGRYGVCEACGQGISFGYAYTCPTTTQCAACDGKTVSGPASQKEGRVI